METVVDVSGWPALIFASQVIFAATFVYLYFRSLRQSAQQAILFATPVYEFFRSDRGDMQILSAMSGDDIAVEHIDGRVDLDLFSSAQIEPSPVVRGDMWVQGGKRISDVALSILLILFTLPLLLVVSIAIKMTSSGPVFYRQTRVGLDGKPFEIIKFRSMTIDAEANGAQWAGQNDQRVTLVGRIIRKTRIDEIPQAINILKGDMSFVGPRPERPQFTAMLAEQIPHYNERHRVKPGLTGWAQVNYPYGASVEDAYEKLRYDLYYLKNHSLLLDLFIIMRTVAVAMRGTGSR